MAREYLKSRKQKIKEIDVSENPKAAQWVMDNVGQIVTPVIDINGHIVVGFDREQIDLALRA